MTFLEFFNLSKLLAYTSETLAKCLKPWDWLISPNEVDEGGKTKVKYLKLSVAETFLGKLTVVFSCAPIRLTIAIGIQDHRLKNGLWVSWLKVDA